MHLLCWPAALPCPSPTRAHFPRAFQARRPRPSRSRAITLESGSGRFASGAADAQDLAEALGLELAGTGVPGTAATTNDGTLGAAAADDDNKPLKSSPSRRDLKHAISFAPDVMDSNRSRDSSSGAPAAAEAQPQQPAGSNADQQQPAVPNEGATEEAVAPRGGDAPASLVRPKSAASQLRAMGIMVVKAPSLNGNDEEEHAGGDSEMPPTDTPAAGDAPPSPGLPPR